MDSVSLNRTSNPAAGEPDYTFKGHSQPPPDERLLACKKYLANEDVNSTLDFKAQLSQIEELIQDLEEKRVNYDSKLFRDVKVMTTVQREWLGTMEAPPCDMNPLHPNPNEAPPISNRLISRESRRQLQDERDALGLTNQVRQECAPFAIERQDHQDHQDHLAFLLKLKQDQAEDPELVEEATNLVLVENRAYNWALKEPSLIPVWLHPRLGLVDKGIRATDKDPWYRRDLRPSGVRRRPAPQKLPDYLQIAQRTVNTLLQSFANGAANDDEVAQLEKFLIDFELPRLKLLRRHREEQLEHYPD